MSRPSLPWTPLDPTKADMGAVAGCYRYGTTILELADGRVLITGHMSCGNRESAEPHIEALNHPLAGFEADRRISLATLKSWIAS